tara:strand:- start:519 stop:824 length:306 start_codon:yes stop_codon:yes gene_type:complete
MPLEKSIVRAIKKSAKENGWLVFKWHGGQFSQAGVPDLLCLKNGNCVFLEAKQPGKKPTQLQLDTMERIRSVGGVACFVVHSREEADNCLSEIEKNQSTRA